MHQQRPAAAPSSTASAVSNPLRSTSAVRSISYQVEQDSPPPQLPPIGDSQELPLPEANQLPQLPQAELPPLPENKPDDLSGAEPAPPPQTDRNPFPAGDQEMSPFDRLGAPDRDAQDPAAEEESKDREDLKIPKRSKDASTISCNELREQMRNANIRDISLDVSPEYGEGLRAREERQKQRLNFAASAPIRDWTDYTNTVVATGRMIDLRDDRVVLDIDGREKLIPLRDLSDIDVAYVADAWNLPNKCGIGYDAYAGRQFIPSAIEWKASGLSHKPLYFEDVQLERYGHEVGPVLQPLLSSAHFFGNALLLPYKMGIHPPSECQYALGYYRPGDCAPYMVQPFPWSLRGAAVQAGAVTGAAALIP